MTSLKTKNTNKISEIERDLRVAIDWGMRETAYDLKIELKKTQKNQTISRKTARKIKLTHRSVAG